MIKLLGKVPKEICIAVSGGADSMAALDFLSKNRKIKVLHYNHNTEYGDLAERVVVKYCEDRGIEYTIGRLSCEIPKGVSKEDFWRKKRYEFFNKECGNLKVVTCHHLDDAVETWIFTSLHGQSRLIPHSRDQFIRPFLASRKEPLISWCDSRSVPFANDPSNLDTKYMRNYIRHILLPKALDVNPGLHKVVLKKIKQSYIKECKNVRKEAV